MTRLDEEIVSSVKDFSEMINIFAKRENPNDWWFRGEAFLYDNPLTPSIFRDGAEPTNEKHPDRAIADKEIEKCRLKVKNGEIYNN